MSVMCWRCSLRTRAKLTNDSIMIIGLSVVAAAMCLGWADWVLAADIQTNSRAEAWVLKRVLAGQVADLTDPSAHLPKESNRALSASFLERVLTDPSQSAKLHRRGVQIRHAVFPEEIDLTYAHVSRPVRLELCHFLKKVDLSNSLFGKTLSFYGSTFSEDASFYSMQVGGTAIFDKVEFAGPVNFRSADIASNFEAEEAHFTNAKEMAIFNSMKVGHSALFTSAEFAGPVNFVSADIASNLQADKAHFTNAKQAADFNSMKVGHTAFFMNAEFAGPVNFGSADIASNFEADKAHFTNAEQAAIFNNMQVGDIASFRNAKFAGSVYFNSIKVGHSAFFNDAEFAGPVNFGSANIASNFEADKAHFTNAEQEANFYSMKVGRSAFFRSAEFAGSVDFRWAIIASNFGANGAHFTNAKQAADFNSMQVGSIAWFDKTDFRGAFNLGDMTYRGIRVGEETDQDWWKSLITLVNQSRYNAATYTNLEAFLKRVGYPDYADEVFIAQKWRERDETLPWYTFGYWWNWFLYCLVAYGREPSRAFVVCIVFIVVGYLTFRRPEQMEPQKEEYVGEPYSPFWYSLGLFLPFVNLYAAEVWRPKKECRWARIYMRVHILLGWILVPLGLAAVTGLIK